MLKLIDSHDNQAVTNIRDAFSKNNNKLTEKEFDNLFIDREIKNIDGVQTMIRLKQKYIAIAPISFSTGKPWERNQQWHLFNLIKMVDDGLVAKESGMYILIDGSCSELTQ